MLKNMASSWSVEAIMAVAFTLCPSEFLQIHQPGQQQAHRFAVLCASGQFLFFSSFPGRRGGNRVAHLKRYLFSEFMFLRLYFNSHAAGSPKSRSWRSTVCQRKACIPTSLFLSVPISTLLDRSALLDPDHGLNMLAMTRVARRANESLTRRVRSRAVNMRVISHFHRNEFCWMSRSQPATQLGPGGEKGPGAILAF